MPVLKLEESKEFGLLPDETMILIEVESINTRDVPGKNGNEGWTKLEFKCIIRDIPASMKQDDAYSEMVGAPIWGSVNMRFTMHPDNKLRQWAEALLNMGELDAGFEMDTDLLIGRQAKAITSQYDGRSGKRHQIEAMLPPGPLGGSSAPIPDFLQQARVQTPEPQPEPQPAMAMAASAPVYAQTGLDDDDDPPF